MSETKVTVTTTPRTVYTRVANLIPCADCGGLTTDYVAPGRHAPHWRDGVLVNCMGREVAP